MILDENGIPILDEEGQFIFDESFYPGLPFRVKVAAQRI